jgi:hypothetical protein
LPRHLLDLQVLVVAGTAVWFVVFVVLWLAATGTSWQWTAMAGWVLGLIGMAVMWWQRKASRSGSRGAQRNL